MKNFFILKRKILVCYIRVKGSIFFVLNCGGLTGTDAFTWKQGHRSFSLTCEMNLDIFCRWLIDWLHYYKMYTNAIIIAATRLN
jgi:hypothetical protein